MPKQVKKVFFGLLLILAAIGIVINLNAIIKVVTPDIPYEEIGAALDREALLSQEEIDREFARTQAAERELEYHEQFYDDVKAALQFEEFGDIENQKEDLKE